MRLLLIVNPQATNVTQRHRERVERLLGERHDVRVAMTTHRSHASEIARDADDVEGIVVLSGDGTLNEVAAGILERHDDAGRPWLAPLPGGGTNVFARTIGVPHRVEAATRALLDAIDHAAIERIGVGSVNGRISLFHCGIGWDAALVSVVERHAAWKRRVGHGLFVYAGLRTYFGGYDRRRPHFRVRFDDGVELDDGYFAIVMNSDPYTFVGRRPFTIAPTTRLDGPLTVVVLRSMSVRHFLPLIVGALRDRRGLSERPWLTIRTGVEHVVVKRITTPYRAALRHQVDGDLMDEVDEIEVRHLPGALDVVVPRGRVGTTTS